MQVNTDLSFDRHLPGPLSALMLSPFGKSNRVKLRMVGNHRLTPTRQDQASDDIVLLVCAQTGIGSTSTKPVIAAAAIRLLGVIVDDRFRGSSSFTRLGPGFHRYALAVIALARRAQVGHLPHSLIH